MEVQQSQIVSDAGVSMSSGFPLNTDISCPSDPISAPNRLCVNNAISVNNNSGIAMPATSIGMQSPQLSTKEDVDGSNTCTNTVFTTTAAAASRDFHSGVTFTASRPPSGSFDFRHTGLSSGNPNGIQGNSEPLQENNLFTNCTPIKNFVSTNTSSSSGIMNNSGSHIDPIKTNDLDSGPNTSEQRDEDSPTSGINLACSETGSNFGEEEEDNKMDTDSVYSFRSDMDQGSTINGSQCSESTVLHPTSSTSSSAMPRRTKNGILLRDRTNRLPVADRVRQKRSTMQDMARPLKHWLCKHRHYPYPSKSDKQELAAQSNMSLTQVSNWFANARRRLKNTVGNPECSWETRIRQYNSHVKGNAELLSVSSDSGAEEEGDNQHQVPPPANQNPESVTRVTSEGQSGVAAESDVTHDVRAGLASPVQHKFKQSILHRYLNDSFEHSLQFRSPFENRSRNPSGSVGSHDFEDCSMSMSSRSSPIHEHSFDDVPEDLEQLARQWEGQPKRAEDELYWKEISAALALTTLARSRYFKV